MSPEDLYALATKLESLELAGTGAEPLSRDEVYPVLEALLERGVDLSPALRPGR